MKERRQSTAGRLSSTVDEGFQRCTTRNDDLIVSRSFAVRPGSAKSDKRPLRYSALESTKFVIRRRLLRRRQHMLLPPALFMRQTFHYLGTSPPGRRISSAARSVDRVFKMLLSEFDELSCYTLDELTFVWIIEDFPQPPKSFAHVGMDCRHTLSLSSLICFYNLKVWSPSYVERCSIPGT